MIDSQEKNFLFEKVNISQNKEEGDLLNKSDKFIMIKNIDKKSLSPPTKIRAYKNKYNSPEINRLNPRDKNSMLLDIKHFKNKSKENNIIYNPINTQIISKKNFYNEIIGINRNQNELDPDNENNRLTFTENFSLNNEDNLTNFTNNVNSKLLKKSKSTNEYNLGNKEQFEELNKRNYDLIKIRFPRENIITNKSIEIIPGNLQLLYPENNKNLIRNTDKQIINQENIIINNGFVNMNNNYYVNNNNIENNNNNNQKQINDNYSNLDNDKYINQFNTNNYFEPNMVNLNFINKIPDKLSNMNYNNYYINPNKIPKLNALKFNFNNNKNIFIPQNENKESNYNLDIPDIDYNNKESYNSCHTPRISSEKSNIRMNISPPYYKKIGLSRTNYDFINYQKQFINPVPNPQNFRPNFHPNISFNYISILKIQYPVQIMIKKSKKKIILAKNKLINYYPPKVQLEIRPCFIFQSLNQKKINNKKIQKNKKNKNKVKHKRPVFKIPPCKKACLSQGKSLTFIHKYYDENFILEEDDEEENNIIKCGLNTERNTNTNNETEIMTNKISIDINNDENNNVMNEKNINDKNKEIENQNSKNNNIDNIIDNSILNSFNSDNSKYKKEVNENQENKIERKQKIFNYKNKIPIRKEKMNKKAENNKIILINIKKPKLSPLKEIINHRNNIKNIFSLKNIKQRFNSLNSTNKTSSTRVNSEKKEKPMNNKNKKIKNNENSKIKNKKDKNIKIINNIPKKIVMKKNNSFNSKKINDNKNMIKINSYMNNSYKNLLMKKINEKNNFNNSYDSNHKNIVVKIDLSKI